MLTSLMELNYHGFTVMKTVVWDPTKGHKESTVRSHVTTLYLLFVWYNRLTMDRLNPKLEAKHITQNIGCDSTDDLSFFVYYVLTQCVVFY